MSTSASWSAPPSLRLRPVTREASAALRDDEDADAPLKAEEDADAAALDEEDDEAAAPAGWWRAIAAATGPPATAAETPELRGGWGPKEREETMRVMSLRFIRTDTPAAPGRARWNAMVGLAGGRRCGSRRRNSAVS